MSGKKSLEERCDAADVIMLEVFAQIDAGEEPDFERLRGLPGLRLEPTTWEELTSITADGGAEALSTLGRSPLAKKAYRKHLQALKRDYASVTDYLLAKVFDAEVTINEEGRRVAVVPPDFRSTRRTEWRDNDYPYHFEAGVKHCCLWASVPLTQDELREAVAAHVGPDMEYTYFVNPPVLMSVPTLWHAHVMFRKRS